MTGPVRSRGLRLVFVTAGWIALSLGFIGIFLPLLPTTPFVLLAGFCFSKGSERLHQWLLQSRTFGTLIRDWERAGVVRPRAKIVATILILTLFGYTLGFVRVAWQIKAVVAVIGAWVLVFLWTRPSRPPDESSGVS